MNSAEPLNWTKSAYFENKIQKLLIFDFFYIILLILSKLQYQVVK